MNYCIHLKKSKNKPFCKLITEEITFSRCRECDNKEYKKCTKFSKNSAKALHTSAYLCTPLQSNSHQISKVVKNKQINSKKPVKMKVKSNKLAKLERNRFSVFTDNKDSCMVCKSTYLLTWHEIFAGRNRRNSMKDGFCLRLCLNCHEEKQEDTKFNDFWHREAQLYFEKHIGSREQFIARYRRNYIKEEKDN